MTTISTFRKKLISMAIVAPAILSLCLAGCKSRPQEQGYQPNEEKKRQIEQGVKKTNEEMKTLTTGYGKEMQHVAPDYPTQPISRHKKKTTPQTQQTVPQPPSKSTQP
jgi:hypothetical protein